MRIHYIDNNKFNIIKKNLLMWIDEKLKEDNRCIFHFSEELSEDNKSYIFSISDNFIIERNYKNNYDNNLNCNYLNSNNYDIVMRAGRKYANKLLKNNGHNMGIIHDMNETLSNTNININIINLKLNIFFISFAIFYIMNSFAYLCVFKYLSNYI